MLKNIFRKNNKKINTESLSAMTISADIISVNTKYGHFEIGDETGVTKEIQLDKYVLKIVGGIITNIEMKGEK